MRTSRHRASISVRTRAHLNQAHETRQLTLAELLQRRERARVAHKELRLAALVLAARDLCCIADLPTRQSRVALHTAGKHEAQRSRDCSGKQTVGVGHVAAQIIL